MIILVSGATADVREAGADIGALVVPGQGICLDVLHARPWAADNGAFSGFDAAAFLDMLRRVRGVPGCRFVAAPDVVGEATATLDLFDLWEPMIRALGFPVALVAQDGLTARAIPWPRVDALFIGGSTEWKLSRDADTLLAYAAVMGKWRHVGRVNSQRRMRHFYGLTDSIDGSGFSQWPKRIALATRWVQMFQRQPRLRFGA